MWHVRGTIDWCHVFFGVLVRTNDDVLAHNAQIVMGQYTHITSLQTPSLANMKIFEVIEYQRGRFISNC